MNLEEQLDIRSKGHSITISLGEELAVIKDGVHGLNPKCVDRAIEDEPREVLGVLVRDVAATEAKSLLHTHIQEEVALEAAAATSTNTPTGSTKKLLLRELWDQEDRKSVV